MSRDATREPWKGGTTLEPRRVLYVINDLAPGGAQRVILNQARFLDRARFTPEVASFEFIPQGEMIPVLEQAGIPVHTLRHEHEPPLIGAARLHALLGRLRPDLVHTHLAAAGVLARLMARAHRVPRIVTTLHNLSDWEEKRESPLRWVDRCTLELTDAVVAVSDAVRSGFTRTLPRLADRAITIHNGVPLEEFAGARDDRHAMRAALGYQPEDFVVGTVARLDPRKGLDILIDAMAEAAPLNPRLRLLVIGDGPEGPRLTAQIRARGISDRALLVRHQIRVRSYLGSFDLFAAPSRTEGLGVAIIESLAAGVPVLAARVGGIPEVVEDGVCGKLLTAAGPEVWAREIVRLAGHRERLAEWSAAARRRARSFSVEASGLALQGLYDRLLDLEAADSMPDAAAA